MTTVKPCRRRWSVVALLAATISACGVAYGDEIKPAAAADVEFYERKIRPLLAAKCYECHAQSAKRREAGLLLDTSAGIRRGGENGPLVDPQKPAGG
ncbi:MAG: hypothetical protein JNK76_17575, partial [Planctomycetales bacterium]|nr:hypothetical protein [Planctomycetales bacterium]